MGIPTRYLLAGRRLGRRLVVASGLLALGLQTSFTQNLGTACLLTQNDPTGQDPTSPPFMMCPATANSYNYGNGGLGIYVKVEALQDPCRPQVNSPSRTNITYTCNNVLTANPSTGNHYTYINASYVSETWGGYHHVAWANDVRSYQFTAGSVSGGWPSEPNWGGSGQNYPQNGYYKITFSWDYGNSGENRRIMYAWIVNGAWTREPPPITPLPGTADPGTGVAPPAGDSSYRLRIRAFGPSVTPIDGLTVTVSGSAGSASTQTMAGLGTPWIVGLSRANATVRVNGTVSGVTYDSTRTVLITGGDQVVDFTFDGSGNLVSAGGDPTTASGSGSFITDALKAAFTPTQDRLDKFKRSRTAFYDWGPISFINELSALDDVTSTTAPSISIPVLQLSGGSVTTNGTPVAVDYQSISGTSGYAAIRSLMGVAVWLAFAGVVVRRMMPRQVM